MTNIDYKTAKKLKDIGFPQNAMKYYVKMEKWESKDNKMVKVEPVWEIQEWGKLKGSNMIAIPSLEEVIDELGVKYKEKYEFALLFVSGEWFAGYMDGKFKQPDDLVRGGYKTALESAINLYIAINK